jgi:hypothetical protein
MKLYDFLDSKINVGGYIMPSYRQKDIIYLEKKLEKKKINLNYETYDYIFYCFSDLNQFLRIITCLYLPEELKSDRFYDQSYYSIFFALQYFYNEEIPIDNDLRDIINVFVKNKIEYFEDEINKCIYYVITRYYWVNRDKLSIDGLDNLISKLKNNNYRDAFIMNGIIDGNGRPLISQENYYYFIDTLLKQKNKMIVK